ncbi:MAG TPA: response regulator [Anaeromyxobacteraceae bacterium]|nr:response regulator [Anaeromyxobacteraceae bacterium]
MDTSMADTPTTSVGPAKRSQALRVLLIDDDPLARSILSDALSANGFEVAQAENGREAVRAIVSGKELPNVVLTDLLMPDMDGRTVLALLRLTPGLASVPVMVVTGSPRAYGLERELEDKGAAAVLDKSWGPATIAEVVSAIVAVSGKQSMAA